MEIEPRKQKTWPDFVVTEQMWGVRAIDTSEVRREGRRLFYRRDGTATRRSSASTTASSPTSSSASASSCRSTIGDDLDVEWAGHPAWYFRISKFSIPFLRHPSVPRDVVPRRASSACPPIATATC